MNEQNKKQNKMKQIIIDSLVLHCSTADQAKLDRAFKLLKLVSGAVPIKTTAKKRIPTWKLRPGLQIGCKVTIRGKKAVELLKVILTGAPELKENQFNPGFLSFGIKEYIEIPSIPYQREIGIMGFDVMVTLKRPGFKIRLRKRFKSKIGKSHKITKTETLEFFKKNFDIKFVDETAS